MARKRRVKVRPLQAAVKRTLAIRLGVAAAVISILAATAVFYVERGRMRDQVVDIARRSATRFNHQVLTLFDDPANISSVALQRELEAYTTSPAAAENLGDFVYAGIYSLDGVELARLVDDEYAHIDAVRERMNEIGHTQTQMDKQAYTGRVGGRPHILVILPLVDRSGVAIARIEGIFAVSEAALASISRRIARTITAAIAVVLFTTLLIYPVIATLIGRLSRLTESLLDSNIETLKVLGSAIAKRDSDTDSHNYRVTVIAVRLAEEISLDAESIRGIIKGGFLHDVGKIGIRDAILLKPGPLTDEEYEVMKTHVNHGLDIVERSEWLRDATDIVGFHHEKYAGGGYVKGLQGDGIPVSARIFAIADVFDALTSKRPYKEPLSFDETMEVLTQGRGTHFDPNLFDHFIRIARSLYDSFANREDEPREELDYMTQRYFKDDIRIPV